MTPVSNPVRASFFAFAALTAIQLAVAQALWKHGVQRYAFSLDRQFLLSRRFVTFVLSPFVAGGLVLYVIATGCYMNLLANYSYAVVQASVIALTLVFSFLLAAFVFNESISATRLAGLVVLIAGVALVSR